MFKTKLQGMEKPKFYTRYRTRLILGQTEGFLNALIDDGYLPTITVKGRQYIPSSAVLKFLEFANGAQGEKTIATGQETAR